MKKFRIKGQITICGDFDIEIDGYDNEKEAVSDMYEMPFDYIDIIKWLLATETDEVEIDSVEEIIEPEVNSTNISLLVKG